MKDNFPLYYTTGKLLYKKLDIKNDWVNIGIISLIRERLNVLSTENPELYENILKETDIDKASELLLENIMDRFKVGRGLH